jgi:hypothetical protein
MVTQLYQPNAELNIGNDLSVKGYKEFADIIEKLLANLSSEKQDIIYILIFSLIEFMSKKK